MGYQFTNAELDYIEQENAKVHRERIDSELTAVRRIIAHIPEENAECIERSLDRIERFLAKVFEEDLA